jgi:hypothetical protein
MAKVPWYMKVLMCLRLVSAKVEDSTIGAGKKTATGGKIAGAAIDGVTQVITGGEDGVDK